MSFFEKYQRNLKEKSSFLCVGLDPDPEKIPQQFLKEKNPMLAFSLWVMESSAPYAVAFKPNCAFFEAAGEKGFHALEAVCKASQDSGIPLILDAKRGDIGNTAGYYARSAFEHFKADAVTLAPYMGLDSIEPFARYQDRACFVLGLTSNPSAADFEKLTLGDGRRLFEAVIGQTLAWRKNFPNLGLVLGATQEEELKALSASLKGVPLLVPGVGAQGGSLEQVIRYLYQENALCVNVSRGVLYAENPGKAASDYAQEMQRLAGL